MIFISKNEKDEPAWKLILEGRKTVTRRLKPIVIGKSIAVCPGRGKKAVCRILTISCEPSMSYFRRTCPMDKVKQWKQMEAELEGFESWDGLMKWFEKHKIQFAETFRIEFESETEVSNSPQG